MIRCIFILCLLTISYNCRAEYKPLDLYEMAIKAEKIVYGTIIGLDSTTFTLKIEGSLTSDSGNIKIERFENWPCASRWTEYKVGQQLFLFLITWNGKLVSMSGGNEGELPVFNNSVFIHGFSLPIPPPPPPKGIKLRKDILYFDVGRHHVYGAKYFGMEWKQDDFIEAISYIRGCFDFSYGQYREETNWRINCDTDELQDIASRNKLVNWVYKTATNKENER